MKKYHQVSNIHFENNKLILTIDNQTIEHNLNQISPALANASTEARNCYEISPSGYGIHWPLIDEDLSTDGLLGIQHAPTNIPKKTEA